MANNGEVLGEGGIWRNTGSGTTGVPSHAPHVTVGKRLDLMSLGFHFLFCTMEIKCDL